MNIKEVARRAGVSAATVSRVLNHPELVQPETKNRVLSTIEALHYTPNWLARGLNLGKTHSLALLVSNIELRTDQGIFAGVETVAMKKGYATVLYNTHGDPRGEADCLAMVQDRRVDGVLVCTLGADLSGLREADIPYVSIGRPRDVLTDNCCYINCEEGAYRITKHLLSLGHRWLGLLLDQNDGEDRRQVAVGCRRAAEEWGGEIQVLFAENSVQGGLVTAARLFQDGPRLDALLCDSDEMAFGVLKAAQRQGVSVPGELGLACLTDSPLCTIVTPPLTSLEQPARRLGMVAARMLFDILEEEAFSAEAPQEIILQSKLKIRRSCGNQAHISELFDD